MPREPQVTPVEIPAADLARIKELYLQGRYRAAFDVGQAHGPMRGWSGPAARLIAGRLSMQLGAPLLGRRLHLLAFRESPAYPEAVYYHARYRMERFGPVSCWSFMAQHTDWSEASPDLRADWLALQGFNYARMHDFDRAEKALGQSEALAPNRPWHFVERSSVYEFQEQYSDALTAARRSLEIQPWFRPGVQSVAHLLMRKGKETEAREFLEEAVKHMESGLVIAQLIAMQLDRQQYDDARLNVDRFVELSPMMEADIQKWVAARRSDIAYLLGDRVAARDQALLVNDDEDRFYPEFAERLTKVPENQAIPIRSILPLDQNYDKTPPTSHEYLGKFWNVSPPAAPTEGSAPLEGIPDAAERKRYDDSGWRTAEFTASLPAMEALIARGIPFLLTVVETGYGQSRIVFGLDTVRESVFMAEGGERRPTEAPFGLLIKRFGSTGPRCLVAVPPGSHQLLDGIELPDTMMFDRLYTALCHLLEFRFADAKAIVEAMQADQPKHLLTMLGTMAFAKHTQNPYLLRDAVKPLLEAYPHDATYTMIQSNVLRELGLIHERSKFLEAEGLRAEADPLMQQSLAQLYLANPHRQMEANRLLRRSIRIRSQAASGYYLLASLWWEQARYSEAIEVVRFACCLDDREEQFAEGYIRMSRARDQLSDAIRLFQRRVARSDVPQPPAVRILHNALIERGEPDFAKTALDKAIEKLQVLVNGSQVSNNPGLSFPEATTEDKPPPNPATVKQSLGELLLYRAEMAANAGRYGDAILELETARPYCTSAKWLKSAARVERTKPNFRATLLHMQELSVHELQNMDVHRLTVGLLSDTHGRAGAREYLERHVEQYPWHYALHRMLVEFLSVESSEAIAATEAHLKLWPNDAWAWRQLALIRGDIKKLPEAMEAIQTAAKFEPLHPSYFAVLANIHRRADRTEESMQAFRDGLLRYVDHELCVVESVRTARGIKEKRAALRFIAEQLHEQPTNGEGLLAYRDQALQLIADPEEQEALFEELEKFLDERSDLWTAWSIVIQQMIMMHRSEEATSLGKQATERFPLHSRLWMDLAEAYKQTGQGEERIEALRKATECSPDWVHPAKELSDALYENEEHDEAVKVLERHVSKSPLDPLVHGFLAERLWDADRAEEALKHAEQAVRLEPGYDWAWGSVTNWGSRLDRPDAALDLARDLAKDRAGDPRVFMKLARFLYRYEQTDEALAALDHAIALDPKNPETHDLKSERLAEVGRFDEALAAANPPELQDDLPLILSGRGAWVESRRGNYEAAIPAMQALVSVDPTYYWGWQQLADWFNETGKHDAYLEASDEMCRLRPEHPVPLTYRGEAKILTGDRDGGKADLREALKLQPGYSHAAAILFDACLNDNELREARTALAVLQEHMAGPEGLIKQLNYNLKTKDADAATRTFSDICLAEGEMPPTLLSVALNEMRNAGLEGRAIEAMHSAWSSGDEFNPWAALYWLDTPQGDAVSFEEKMAACDAVIKRYPNFIPGYDRKAEQLTRAQRFDEARQTCQPPHINPLPLTLRGRRAWIEGMEAQLTNSAEGRRTAIQLMGECLKEDPDYAWGWRQIAYWQEDLGNFRECLEAAEQLVRLAPNDPHAYGIRGEAKRLLGDHRGARDDFELAFQIDPNFEAAGHQLMTEQLATDDITGAQRTLATLREHDEGPLLKLRAVQLAVRQKNLTQARSTLESLASDITVPRSMLRDAAREFDEQDWGSEADKELGSLVGRSDCPASAAAVWAERLITGGKAWKVADRLTELTQKSPDAGREVVLVYTWAMAVTGQTETATATIQRFSELLRSTLDGWSRAGATLAEARKYSLAVAWLQDYKDREGWEPWMLRSLADAQRGLGNDEESEAILRVALDQPTAEYPPEMRSWLSLIDAEAGRTEAAMNHLKLIDPTNLADGPQLVYAMANLLIRLQITPEAERGAMFTTIKSELKLAVAACSASEIAPGTARWYGKVVSRIALDTGTFAAKMWAWWQRMRSSLKDE